MKCQLNSSPQQAGLATMHIYCGMALTYTLCVDNTCHTSPPLLSTRHVCGASMRGLCHNAMMQLLPECPKQATCPHSCKFRPTSRLHGLTLASSVACVSVGPSGSASPKSATFAVNGRQPACVQTRRSSCCWAPLPALPTPVLACSRTFPALRSPCLQDMQGSPVHSSVMSTIQRH